jgi:glycolate oxidase
MEAGAELIERSRLVCGYRHVVTDPVALSTYRSDGRRRDGPLPLAVALPANAAEVVGVVTACAQLGIPWVARGAGTSLTGAVVPHAGALVIALTRLRLILAVNLEDDEITAQPGAPLASLAGAVAPTHSLPHDPVSTLGGAVAEGDLSAQLQAAEIVQHDGSVVRVDRRLPGYDLVGAFSGSRGSHGIAVALTLQVVPQH